MSAILGEALVLWDKKESRQEVSWNIFEKERTVMKMENMNYFSVK